MLHKAFFAELPALISDCTCLVGNFNSVVLSIDWMSGSLDFTSTQLHQILHNANLYEPWGSQHYTFTYHHPSIAKCKSRLDRIYLNYQNDNICAFSRHVSFSNHYLVGTFILLNEDQGPAQWQFPTNLLQDTAAVTAIQQLLLNFDYKDPIENWEVLKSCIQTFCSTCTGFHQKTVSNRATSSAWNIEVYQQTDLP